MKAELLNWILFAGKVLHRNSDWMAWNLFLALIPLGLSVWLFRRSRQPSILWWLGLVVFVAFLPNAPYVLTDIIHLIYDIREGFSEWIVTLVLVPQYILFILAGFQAYVLSLINLGHYLNQRQRHRYVLWAELVLHALSALGIYLGRFLRFNSWDLVTRLDSVADKVVDDLVAKRPALVMFVTFIVITGLYWLMKEVTLGLILRKRYRRTFESTSEADPGSS
ncbi:DUF1361 domain-containing protein [Trichocoleus sp. FACHB-262]|uniref:DUF1361 domain-containing protein n=1 Tax=Trichocoleus sp. FACHB-262 TaxID=2692869 RepID=UPI0016866998|nr:DUF1361 domain-containing protein [Trichocoleus sp. FACHB-262]MBD2123353.1 DUF1361 domain-containing protein [Trichocoleus sp. FACHB-262]